MLFHTLEFAVFFAVVFLLYATSSHRWQNRVLLVASYVFYGAWDYRFLSLIWLSTVVDYCCGIAIDEARKASVKKRFLLLSVGANLGLLGVFKYFNFFAGAMQELLAGFGVAADPLYLNVILPVGISFYTFQTMSYTIDIYKGEMRPTRRFLDFALFVAFFPQLVAGPIERAKHLLPQMLEPRRLDPAWISEGMRVFLWGLFKKMVVADRLAVYVDAVYGNVPQHSSLTFFLATLFFAFQIYCDFSGYSDMARGMARILGFDIMINFRNPYLASGPSAFWRGWHISLSTWLRDYLYIPLGGNRRGPARTYFNLMATMVLGGLWHGANWTFLVWGAIHGAFLAVAKGFESWRSGARAVPRLPEFLEKLAGWGVTMAVVLVAWVYFRADSVADANHVVRSMFSPEIALFTTDLKTKLVRSFLVLGILVGFEWFPRRRKDGDVLWFSSRPLRWAGYYAVCFAVILFGVLDEQEAFIYFQF